MSVLLSVTFVVQTKKTCAILSVTIMVSNANDEVIMASPRTDYSRDDYDSPWKQLIEWYFEPFMRFFFPDAHVQIDWQRSVQFLDKELQQIVRDADLGRRYADILVKVWLLNGTAKWVLAHVEVQGSVDAHFDQRMYTYNYRLFDKHGQSVASFAVLCDENPSWQPGAYQYEMLGSSLVFTYTTAKLLDYQERWTELEATDNPFATVVMAHLKTQETKVIRRHGTTGSST